MLWQLKVRQFQWQNLKLQRMRRTRKSYSSKMRIADLVIALPTSLVTFKMLCKNDLSLIDHIYINQLMLSFTHKSKNSTYNINQLDFQPLIISNKEPSPLPLSKNPQKKISKTIIQSRDNDYLRQNSRMESRKSRERFP
jgi:hypothetical protein